MTEQMHPLKKTAVKVLEDWGLMLIDEAPDGMEAFAEHDSLFMAQVEMRGTFHGAISAVASASFLDSLAANLLGAGSPSDEDRRDAFREFANILAGNFLTEGYGADLVFDVTQPLVREASPEDLKKLENERVHFYFLADDAPVAVSLTVMEGK